MTKAVGLLVLLAAILAGMFWRVVDSWVKRRWAPAAPPDVPAGRSAYEDCRMAVHEAGHCVTAWASTTTKTIERVGIDMEIDGEEGRHERSVLILDSDEALWCNAVIKLGGLAAEMMMYGRTRTGGSSSDLLQARAFVRQLAERGATKPPWPAPSVTSTIPFERMFDSKLSDEERRIFGEAYRMARTVISAHRDKHARLVGALLYQRRMNSAEVLSTLGRRPFYVVNLVSCIIHGEREPTAWFYLPKPRETGAADSAA